MPNHFHLLVKQIKDNNILSSLSSFSNSYSKYFNLKHEQEGPVFQGRFQAVRIITNEQFLHVNRYIHLNPYTSSIIKSIKELNDYPYSSLKEYLHPSQTNICETATILDEFKSRLDYQNFILDQADYQKQLHQIKSLTLV